MPTARLNGITPEIGTILPGGRWGGYSVVYEVDETGCYVRPAMIDDMRAAMTNASPRSLCERTFLRSSALR